MRNNGSALPYLRHSTAPYDRNEKWDGTGDPRSLKGEQIPLSARIFAVVGDLDALSSDRPYRPAWKPDDMMKYLHEQKGNHFDLSVVDAFLNLVANQFIT